MTPGRLGDLSDPLTPAASGGGPQRPPRAGGGSLEHRVGAGGGFPVDSVSISQRSKATIQAEHPNALLLWKNTYMLINRRILMHNCIIRLFVSGGSISVGVDESIVFI